MTRTTPAPLLSWYIPGVTSAKRYTVECHHNTACNRLSICRTNLATRTSELLLEEAAPVRRLALHEPSAALWTATTATSARCWHVPPAPLALSSMPAHGAAHGLSRTLSPTAGSLGHGGGGGGDSRTFVVGALPLVRARQSFDGGVATCHLVTPALLVLRLSGARWYLWARQAHSHLSPAGQYLP